MPKGVAKHREISRELLAEIVGGKYPAGGKLPSEAQLRTRFHVSRPTIARALRDLQAEGLIERRAGSGTYARAPGQPAVVSPSRQLGLLVPDRGTTEIFDLICGELSGLARAQDYALLFGGTRLPSAADAGTGMDERHALSLCDHFVEQRILGAFFVPFESASPTDVNRQIVDRLASAGIPLVLVDRELAPFPQRSGFDLIATDNFAGGYLLAEHFARLGCRRIAFLRRPQSTSSVEGRIAGAREGLIRAGLEPRPSWLLVGSPEDVRFVRSQVLAGRWEAVICSNDLAAAQLMRSLEKCEARVPDAVRIAGFDDTRFSALLPVALTTVHQPCRDIAAAAFQALSERMARPTLPVRTILLPPRLVVRESCGAYPSRTDAAAATGSA